MRSISMTLITLLLSSKLVFACGGLFCNNVQPVNQVAERILFAQDGSSNQYQMHVQIQYQGPPQAFSWMLPVPPGTEFALSSPALFTTMDGFYTPRFFLNYLPVGICPDPDYGYYEEYYASGETGNQPEDTKEPEAPTVQVLSRENIGPYEKVSLKATVVADLIDWLRENNYQVPDRSEEVLSPYIGDYEFIAIKLLEGKMAGDIRPIVLSFNAPSPSIPLKPTAVAAQADMGVIVHILGNQRAIPINYSLVEINEATIDWLGRGTNYPDVVSQAIDESPNHQGFTTDYAGAHNLNDAFLTLAIEKLNGLEEMRTIDDLVENFMREDLIYSETLLYIWMSYDPELGQIFDSEYQKLNPMSFFTDIYYQCVIYQNDVNRFIFQDNMFCNEARMHEIDGAALKERIITEYIEVRNNIIRLFDINNYMTRLYTTLSPDEMTLDPVFSFNVDVQSQVPVTRQATMYYDCQTGENLYIQLSNGLEIDIVEGNNPAIIARQNGETVRGQDQIGASMISRPLESGQPEIIQDNQSAIRNQFTLHDSNGCQNTSSGQIMILFVLLSLLMGFFGRLLRNTKPS
jgi:hypothetical protein